jgi:hypothetical protein
MPTHGKCALCLTEGRLATSHVLPAFVFRWFRETSITGHMRFAQNPKRRVQDGEKKPWLCDDCEQRLSGYERRFANDLFYPWLSGTTRIRYEEWLLKFCVSVSWRVLNHFRDLGEPEHYSADQVAAAERASQVWREFLLGDRVHPGAFEQHLVIFDAVEEASIQLPQNVNRYLLRSVAMDVVGGKRVAMTYAKLGRFAVFGMIEKGGAPWQNTKVHVREGLLKPQRYVLPAPLADYLREKADAYASVAEQIPEHQRDRIEARAMRDIDRLIETDQFAAMMHDHQLFGDAAPTLTPPPPPL